MRGAFLFTMGVNLTICTAIIMLHSCQPASVQPAQADPPPVDMPAPVPPPSRLVPQEWRHETTATPVLVTWGGDPSQLFYDTERKEPCAIVPVAESAWCLPRRLVGKDLTAHEAARWVSFSRGDAP